MNIYFGLLRSGNLTHLLIPEEQIWTPKLSIANPSDRVPIFPEDQFSVRLFSTGRAMLLKGGTVRCTCKPNLRYYPFDEHVCFVKLITLDNVFTEISFLPISARGRVSQSSLSSLLSTERSPDCRIAFLFV